MDCTQASFNCPPQSSLAARSASTGFPTKTTECSSRQRRSIRESQLERPRRAGLAPGLTPCGEIIRHRCSAFRVRRWSSAWRRRRTQIRSTLNSGGAFAQLALECVHREYPNKIAHVLQERRRRQAASRAHAGFLRLMTTGHSSVHGHWLLAPSRSRFPTHQSATQARTALARSSDRPAHRDRSGVSARRRPHILRAPLRSGRLAAASRRRSRAPGTTRRRALGEGSRTARKARPPLA